MSWKDFAEKFTNGQQGTSGGETTSGGWEAFRKKFEAMQNGQSSAGKSTSGWDSFRRRMTGEPLMSSDDETYQNSGMDALRKDADALASGMASYFYYSHGANTADQSYRAKTANMLSAIDNERKYFEYYADRFTQEDLAQYMAELDQYEEKLRSYDSYFGDDNGNANSRDSAIIGSGYAALSNRIAQLGLDLQNFTQTGQTPTEGSRKAMTFRANNLSRELEQTRQYLKKNAGYLSDEDQKQLDDELGRYESYLSSVGAYLENYGTGLKNPFTGGKVPSPAKSADVNGDGVADGVYYGIDPKKDFEKVDQQARTSVDSMMREYLPEYHAEKDPFTEALDAQTRAEQPWMALSETTVPDNRDAGKTEGRRYGRDYNVIWDELTAAYDELYNLQNQAAQYSKPDRSTLPENYANEHLVDHAEQKYEEQQQGVKTAQEKFDRLAEEATVVGSYIYHSALDESAAADNALTSGEGAADSILESGNAAKIISDFSSGDSGEYITTEGRQRVIYAFINSEALQNYAFDTVKELSVEYPSQWSFDEDYWRQLTQLSDEERRAYNYLYNSYGAAEAEQFLNVLINGVLSGSFDNLKTRQAEQQAESWNQPVGRFLVATGIGLSSLLNDIKATLSGDVREPTTAELTLSKMSEDSGWWGRAVIGAGQSFGRMLPSMAVSAVTGVPLLGTLTTGLTSGVSGYQEGMRHIMDGGKGFSSPLQGIGYGILSGASEAGLQALAGNIPGLKGVLPEALGEKLAEKVSSAFGKWAVKYGAGLASEVLEENVQNYLEPLFVTMLTGREYEAPGWDDFVDTTLSTLVLTGGLNLANAPIDLANERAEIYNSELAFAEAAMKFPKGSEIYNAGTIVQEALSNGETLSGKAFRSVVDGIIGGNAYAQKIKNGTLTAQDAQNMVTEVYAQEYTAAGLDREYTAAASAALYKVASGETVRQSDIQKLRLNTEAGAKVLSDVMGVDVPVAKNNGKDANRIFREAEFSYRVKENSQIYGNAELDVRNLVATQESADAILANEKAKADFQSLFGEKLHGTYAEQSEQIIRQLGYWQSANWQSVRQETAAQQVERWNAEHPQTVQDAANVQQGAENAANVQQGAENAANVQQGAENAANVQQGEENTQVNIDNAANSGYNETKTQESGGVSVDGNGVDSGVAEGVSGHGDYRQGSTPARRSGREDQVVSGGALSESLRNAMKNSGVVPTELHDFGSDIAAFSSALLEARNADPENGWCVSYQTEGELKGKLLFMDEARSIGFAITPDGDIEAVFKNKEKNHTRFAMNGVMPQIIALGGVKLDCYGLGLVRAYERYGFIPVARVEFNEAYANDGWDASKGTPYIYFMIHNGDSAETVAANIGKYEHMSLEQLNALPTYGKEGYDEAAAYRDGLLPNKNDESVGAAKSGFDPYTHALNEYGAIEPGENPARVVDVPKSMDGSSRVSQVVRTAMEARSTTKSGVEKLEDAVAEGMFSYDRVTNKERAEAAKKWFSEFDSTDAALDSWRDKLVGGRMRPADYANGIYLYTQLMNQAKNAKKGSQIAEQLESRAVGVLSTLQKQATEFAQMVQMNRMFKQLSGNGKITALRYSISNLNEQLTNGVTVQANETLIRQYKQALDGENKELASIAEQNIYRDIAAQVPSTFMDKWNAWRYLSMLGNPKTMIRNFAGNVFMMPLKATKDKIGAVLELGLNKKDRTKYLGAISATENGRELLAYAKEDYAKEADAIMGNGKYDERSAGSKLAEAVRDKKSELPGFRWAQKGVDWLMNNEKFGDKAFLKHHYAASFAGAALARGYTADDIRNGNISTSQLDSIRTYAIEQAQKATYRDLNAFSKLVKNMRFKGNGVGSKIGNTVIEGMLPFKSTPANVLVRATEYSPLGVIRAIGDILTNYAQRKKGGEQISGAQIIEHLSAGLSGSAVLTLGILLNNMGIITGAGDDDDDREGRQSWSINIGDTSVSLDWLAPASIPFFMGVSISDAWNDPHESAIAAITDTLGAMFEPMLEMSMLSGVQDMLDSMSYAESGDIEKIGYAVFAQPFISYLGQGIPTLLSQGARMLDENNEYTYTGDISGSVNKRFVKSLAKVAKKIPFVNWRQYDYVDEWGRTESNGNVIERFLNNFVNPAYTSEIVVTDADDEIKRLEAVTGESVAPTRRSYSITVNGEKRELSGEEYERYSKTYGEEALNMMSALMASDTYARLDDDGKVAAMKDVLDIANEFGKHAALAEYAPKSEDKLYTLTKAGVPVSEAYAAKLYRKELEDSDLKASTKTANFENWVSHRDWTQAQKDAVLEAYGGFTTTLRADAGKYDALSTVIGEDKALDVVETLDGLTPESGASSVSEAQKIEAIAGMNLADDEKWDAFATYKDDWRIAYFEDAGLNPNVYAAYLRAIPEYRLTGSGTKSSTWNTTTIWNWLRTTEYSSAVKQKIAKIALMSKPKEENE